MTETLPARTGAHRAPPKKTRYSHLVKAGVAIGAPVLSVLFGCQGDRGAPIPEDAVRITRLFDVAEVEEFKREDALSDLPVFSWSLADRGEASRWMAFRDSTHISQSSSCLSLEATDKIRLHRDVDLDSEVIDVIEVGVSGMSRGKADLFWAAPTEAFKPENRVRVELIPKLTTEADRIRFPVADIPSWRGKIARIRLDFQPVPNQGVELCGLSGFKSTIRDDLAPGDRIRTFAVDLGNTVKNGIVVPTETELRLRVKPEGPETSLFFSYGIQLAQQGTSVRFHVAAERPNGDDHVTLFDSTADDDVWHDAELDLSGFGNGDLTLVLRADRVGSPIDRAALASWADLRMLSPATETPPPNVILISLDTLRADALSLYGNPRETTPLLDAWAGANAVVFKNSVAAAPWTLPSHISMLTGIHAHHHGVNHGEAADESFVMLAERLRDRGLATRAVTGGGFLDPVYGYGQGFDVYSYWNQRSNSDDEIDVTFRTAVGWLRELRNQPFFLFVHTYEPHTPYLPRQPYFDDNAPDRWRGFRGRMLTTPETREDTADFRLRKEFVVEYEGQEKRPATKDEYELARLLYESGVAYTDTKLELILTAVRELGLESNTLIVITSDHGEALGEKGLAAHAYLYDFNTMVPLVIAFPGGEHSGRQVDTQVAAVDLVPTILESLGMEPPSGLDGSSLLRRLDGKNTEEQETYAITSAASSNYGVALRRSNATKLIFNNTAWNPLRGTLEAFDLERDPGEETNLGGDAEFVTAALEMIDSAFEESAGIHLVVDNLLGDPLVGEVVASRISPTWVKSMCAPEVDLEWKKPGTVLFSVPPGMSCHLLFDWLESETLEIRGQRSTSAAEFASEVSVSDLTEPWRLSHVNGSWSEGSLSDAERITGITLWIRGSGFGAAGEPVGMDEQHLEQLRALGYVE